MSSRLGPPFEGSERARVAYWNAAYMNSSSMGLDLDEKTGEITTAYDFEGGKKALKGSPGEVMTDPRFYIPQVRTEADRIDLAFVLGYLLATQKAQGANG